MADKDKVIQGLETELLSAMQQQNNALLNAFNPEVMAFRNEVMKLRENCPMVEWEHDMGASFAYCKLDNSYCNGQCAFKTDDCPCDTKMRR